MIISFFFSGKVLVESFMINLMRYVRNFNQPKIKVKADKNAPKNQSAFYVLNEPNYTGSKKTKYKNKNKI